MPGLSGSIESAVLNRQVASAITSGEFEISLLGRNVNTLATDPPLGGERLNISVSTGS